MIYWEEELERLPQSGIQRLQVSRMKAVIIQAGKSPFYRRLHEEAGITPERFNSVEDISELPFTTKENLRENFPYGFLAVDKIDVVRLHSSSGTTGNPTVIFHTRQDLDNWANLIARSLFMVGVRNTDVFQNICGYGLFTGGLGFQYGAERLGALTVPAGAGNTKRQIKMICDYETSVIHTIPSYVMRLVSEMHSMGIEPSRDTALRLMVIGAEPHTEEQRERVEAFAGIKAFNSYGLSEMCGPGVAFECEYQNGLHIWEDSFLAEIIDPETLQPVEDGVMGELVITTLNRKANPLIRYRTRDLTRVLPMECPCGRTHRLLDRIHGRTDDMFIIRGCNVFPMQVEKVLMQFPEVDSHYVIHLETIDGLDQMVINVEIRRDWFTDNYASLDNLRKKMARDIRDEVLVTPVIKLVEAGTLPETGGKAVRVIDNRESSGKGCYE